MQKHTQSNDFQCWLLTHLPLSVLAVLVIHRVIKEPFNSNSKPLFLALHSSLTSSSYLVCSLFVSPVSVWNDSEQEATPNTMLIRLEGSLPAITLDLRSSSHFLVPSIRPTPGFPPPRFPSLHLSLCLPTPNLILSSLQIQSHPLLFFCSQTWESSV